ncbi:LCP family protein [Actinopolymorpha sp. B17G11]|uniref:LCP family glycopolymer transferase n=1 Tax=unclassified Actinopolymorpha TaxID=2627063 RepID=UPI0032D8D592
MSESVRDEYGVPRRGPVGPRPPMRPRRPSMSFGLALGLTVIGTLLPGTGLMAANRRRLGSLIFFVYLLLTAGAVYLATTQLRELMHWAVRPEALNVISVVLPVLGLAWISVIVGTYRSLRPDRASVAQRLAGSGMIVALALVILLPLAVGGRYAGVQRGLVEHVFAGEDSRSATRPKNVTQKDPWGGQDRVNVLLLGGDGGKGRIGIRPDSLQVASINTETGDTVLFSLPRNLEKVPFPPDSVLADAYPEGTYDGSGDRLEWMVNSIYENVPQQHPGLLDSDNPGADATKLAVGAALGIQLDYFVLINLEGFKELINALGGITVNINERVAIGGSSDEGVEPSDWLEPGPNQHLNGYNALWFARGRYGSDDYHRMERQRCTMKAIIDQAEPGKVLTRYESIAQSSKDIVFTDIPGSLLPAFVDLSMKVQRGAQVKSIAFTNTIIRPWDPDYDLIRSMVAKAIRSSGTEQVSDPGQDPKPAPDETGSPDATPSPTPTDDSDDSASPSPSTSRTPAPGGDSLDDACAYHPAVD